MHGVIRFIDLGKQIGGFDEGEEDSGWKRQFSFFNTVPDLFIEANGTHVWDSWEDFAQDWESLTAQQKEVWPLERFENLVPDWVKPEVIDGTIVESELNG